MNKKTTKGAPADAPTKEVTSAVTAENAPADKFQTSQQVTPAASAEDVSVASSDFKKKTVTPGVNALKQDKIATVLTSATSGSSIRDAVATGTNGVSSPLAAGLETGTFSGTDGTILGSAAGTPIVKEGDRASSRFGKKLDPTNRKINNLASEQVIVAVQQPSPLSINGGVQGYNGTPMDANARSQKVAGATPAHLLYQRSIDEISRNAVVFTAGQVVKELNREYIDYPTLMRYVDSDGVLQDNVAFTSKRGNYMPTNLTVTIARDATLGYYVSEFKVTDFDVTCDRAPAKVVNNASSNEIIDANLAEVDRQAIDSKAGRETEPNWSPLARAVKQPTQTVAYLRDLELVTGSEFYASLRFATKAMSYQINKAAKDGQDAVTPLKEMLAPASLNSWDEAAAISSPFDPTYYKDGSVALLLDAFDSVGKYRTKADVLTSPRSVKMHYLTGLNNKANFRVKSEFVKALNAVDCFSTIGHDYDGITPIYHTSMVRLVHPLSMAETFGFTQEVKDGKIARTWTSQLFQYCYENRMSRYNMKVTNPLLAGIAYFFDQYCDALGSKLNIKAGEDFTITIPVCHVSDRLGMWDFLVLASAKFIQWERFNSFKDILDYEANFGYPFSQLHSLTELDPLASTQYTMKGFEEPLEAKRMSADVAISWVMPELFRCYTTDKGITASEQHWVDLPWYFTEDQFDFSASHVAKLGDWSGAMSYPVIRAGVSSESMQLFYNMSERDLRLCLDRLITVPGYENSDAIPMYVRKRAQCADGQVSVKLDSFITKKQVLASPRELGWFAYDLADAGNGKDAGNNGWAVKQYFNYYQSDVVSDDLAVSNAATGRAQNFTQKWVKYTAGAEVSSLHNIVVTRYYNLGYMNGLTDGYVGATGAQGTMSDYKYDSSWMYLYTRIQFLPFIVNPFDTAMVADSKPGQIEDMYDFAYVFSLAGFLASDYREDQLNRATQVLNQGYMFVCDPFVNDSPLFR